MPLGTALRHQAVLVIQAAVAQISNSSAPTAGDRRNPRDRSIAGMPRIK
jgi:hypothetical protein